MAKWQFSENAADGETWLRNPSQTCAYVDYVSSRTGKWRRITIATRSWLLGHLSGLDTGGGSRWTVVPTTLVLPDAEGEGLRTLLAAAIQGPELDLYSTAVEDVSS
jgi:hypothetical protein